MSTKPKPTRDDENPRRRPMDDQAESLRRLVRARRDWERLTADPPRRRRAAGEPSRRPAPASGGGEGRGSRRDEARNPG